ncbi:MAG TPA: nucleotide-diphospho-sugar transferase, partial [Cyclobacteriaceae bacterium]|nr:nucleotide-diphospho-sugar transferase [Cyclobacteriaceae bacterium]
RKIVEGVDWECEVRTRFSDRNLNCGIGPSSAFTWFFENEPEGIILEDDCLPSQSFFWYCQELLERYRDDTRVMHIGGNNFLNGWLKDEDYSYYFSRSGHIWGWATWRRAWQKFDFNISLYNKLRERRQFDGFFLNYMERRYRLQKFDDTVNRQGKQDWWDYQWDFARYVNSGLAIVPERNLVTNVGFGAGATHTFNQDSDASALEAHEIELPLSHPPFMIRDVESEQRYFQGFMKDKVMSKLRKWGVPVSLFT